MPADGIAAVRSTSLPVFPPARRRASQRCDFVRDLALEGFFLGSEELSSVLLRYKGMTALHLGLNALTDNGLRSIALLVSHQRDLEYLDIWGNPGMGSPGALLLLKPLTNSRCKLRTLNLSACGLGTGVLAGLSCLIARGYLRALSLANNALGPGAGRELANLIKSSVAALDFSDCGLGMQGVLPVAKALQDTGACSCSLLGLSWNGLGEAGLETILESALQNVKMGGSLQELFLRGSGFVSLRVAQKSWQLAAAAGPFQRLDLSRNRISPEADDLLHDPKAPKEIIQVPERVASEVEQEDLEDDGVYWHRLAAVSLQDKQDAASLDLLPLQRTPARHRTGTLGGTSPTAASPSERRRTCGSLPGSPVALTRAVTFPVSPDVPVRNRRNENEAFEAFIVARSRFGNTSPVSSPTCQRIEFVRPSGFRPKRVLSAVRRPTTR